LFAGAFCFARRVSGWREEIPVPEVRIQPIAPTSERYIDQAFALYRDVIERTEQRPEDEFRALAQRPDYRFLGAFADDDLIGVSVTMLPQDADMWLFEYAAVRPDMRGHGIGANFLMAMRHLAGGQRMGLIEVDAYRGEEDQARRLAFYRKLGCLRVRGVDYILPLDAFGTPPPMWLLALPPTPLASVSVYAIENWLRRIYAQAYGKPLDDPRLAQMIDPLPDEIALDPL
jgi:GNAT superfamily N-acetyltransferase